MPIYQYQCEHCRYTFDVIQSIHDEPLKKCPNCKRLKVNKMITGGASILFKGSGFYSTDSKNKTKEKNNE